LPSLVACGVRLRESFEGTEVFQGIHLSGERSVNSPLTVTLSINQGYPVPLQVVCYYENDHKLTEDQKNLTFQERATPIGETVLPPSPGHRPSEKLQTQSLSFRFSVPEPGNYFLACLTPAAADNGLGVAFVIKEGATRSD